jgi:hypothetical protein
MLTGARIMAIVPTTDLPRAKAFYGETLGLADANVPTPGPQAVYRCGRSTLLEVYERPTAGDAQHTLASWEVSDIRAAVDQLRTVACASNSTTSRRSRPRTASRPLETSERPGSATPTATSCASIRTSRRSRRKKEDRHRRLAASGAECVHARSRLIGQYATGSSATRPAAPTCP